MGVGYRKRRRESDLRAIEVVQGTDGQWLVVRWDGGVVQVKDSQRFIRRGVEEVGLCGETRWLRC